MLKGQDEKRLKGKDEKRLKKAKDMKKAKGTIKINQDQKS